MTATIPADTTNAGNVDNTIGRKREADGSPTIIEFPRRPVPPLAAPTGDPQWADDPAPQHPSTRPARRHPSTRPAASAATPDPFRFPRHTMTSIDLLSPAQTCRVLSIAEDDLLTAVNDGSLPAYNLDGQIRFRMTEVAAFAAAVSRG